MLAMFECHTVVRRLPDHGTAARFGRPSTVDEADAMPDPALGKRARCLQAGAS
jgi:hypothetical protein